VARHNPFVYNLARIVRGKEVESVCRMNQSAHLSDGDPQPQDIVSFGPFRLTAAERLLERNGVRLQLGSRALDILIVLVERAGEVVTK
jgi:DNA-binding response OmpR family regulator